MIVGLGTRRLAWCLGVSLGRSLALHGVRADDDAEHAFGEAVAAALVLGVTAPGQVELAPVSAAPGELAPLLAQVAAVEAGPLGREVGAPGADLAALLGCGLRLPLLLATTTTPGAADALREDLRARGEAARLPRWWADVVSRVATPADLEREASRVEGALQPGEGPGARTTRWLTWRLALHEVALAAARAGGEGLAAASESAAIVRKARAALGAPPVPPGPAASGDRGRDVALLLGHLLERAGPALARFARDHLGEDHEALVEVAVRLVALRTVYFPGDARIAGLCAGLVAALVRDAARAGLPASDWAPLLALRDASLAQAAATSRLGDLARAIGERLEREAEVRPRAGVDVAGARRVTPTSRQLTWRLGETLAMAGALARAGDRTALRHEGAARALARLLGVPAPDGAPALDEEALVGGPTGRGLRALGRDHEALLRCALALPALARIAAEDMTVRAPLLGRALGLAAPARLPEAEWAVVLVEVGRDRPLDAAFGRVWRWLEAEPAPARDRPGARAHAWALGRALAASRAGDPGPLAAAGPHADALELSTPASLADDVPALERELERAHGGEAAAALRARLELGRLAGAGAPDAIRQAEALRLLARAGAPLDAWAELATARALDGASVARVVAALDRPWT